VILKLSGDVLRVIRCNESCASEASDVAHLPDVAQVVGRAG